MRPAPGRTDDLHGSDEIPNGTMRALRPQEGRAHHSAHLRLRVVSRVEGESADLAVCEERVGRTRAAPRSAALNGRTARQLDVITGNGAVGCRRCYSWMTCPAGIGCSASWASSNRLVSILALFG